MRRLVVLVAVATLAVAALSAHAATPGFPYGVAAGEVKPTSVVLWTRASRPGNVDVNLGTPSGSLELRGSVRATKAADLTVRAKVDRLRPATTYSYVFVQGGARSTVGTFTTAPSSTAGRRVQFAISGDADATQGPNGKPGFNRFEIYGRMAGENNAFNINLGDTIYSDSEIEDLPSRAPSPRSGESTSSGSPLPALRRLRALGGALQPLGRPRVRQ